MSLIKLPILALISLASVTAEEPRALFINGRQLSRAQESELRRLYAVVPSPGRYWYDSEGGLWGSEGMGPIGFILPGHDLGRLSPRASAGNTGIFLNGREINAAEAMFYRKLFTIAWHGRLWLDGRTGYVGMEGTRMPLANLLDALRTRAAQAVNSGCVGFSAMASGAIESSVYGGCNKKTQSGRAGN